MVQHQLPVGIQDSTCMQWGGEGGSTKLLGLLNITWKVFGFFHKIEAHIRMAECLARYL